MSQVSLVPAKVSGTAMTSIIGREVDESANIAREVDKSADVAKVVDESADVAKVVDVSAVVMLELRQLLAQLHPAPPHFPWPVFQLALNCRGSGTSTKD